MQNERSPQAPAEHKAVIEFLRGKNGPKVRRGVLNGKRVEFFKGEYAVARRTMPLAAGPEVSPKHQLA